MTQDRTKHSQVIVVFQTLLLCLILGFTYSPLAQDLTGKWLLNTEETQKLQPRVTSIGRRANRVDINVGIILPTPQQSVVTPSKTINPPLILNCSIAEIKHYGNKVDLTCNEIDVKTFRIGNEHGRVTKWRDNLLTERYSSTSRTVSQRFKLKQENKMQVEVIIKPKGTKRTRFILVYDRDLGEQEANPNS